ncbi:MAG: tRNA (adenosine(37)-N6)-threonylcarbamoyltransferase complex dimerization subunit type 1 TsaB [Geitlerinemataceae cyanobacterium]
MPYGFALHTTSTTLGLATIDCPDAGDRLEVRSMPEPRVRTEELGREMLAYLHVRALEFVAPQCWQDCAFIAVAKGPGSFTSTRIGVTAARTFGQQLQIPVFGISTLEAAAFADVSADVWHEGAIAAPNGKPEDRAGSAQASKPRAVSLAAARGEVFAGVYQFDGIDGGEASCLREDVAMSPEARSALLEEFGAKPGAEFDSESGAAKALEFTVEGVGDATAALVRLAYGRWQRGDRPHWSQAVPFYGQHPVR